MYLKKNYQVSTVIPDTTTGTPELWQLQHYLSSIQVDINNLHRELTYWDLYKINYVIDDVNKANGVINNLAPGQAAVIGFEKTSMIDNVARSRGDIVVKLIDNSLFWIPSKSSGIYEPISYSNNTLNYTYKNEEPETTEKSITVTSSSARSIYSYCYSLTSSSTAKTFSAVANIRPVIRFYTNINEVIDIPFSLTLSSSSYTVEWDANPLLDEGWLQVK